jgi:hypothetical protein
MPDSALETNGFPKRDWCGEEGQPGGTMALGFESAVAQFTDAVEDDESAGV